MVTRMPRATAYPVTGKVILVTGAARGIGAGTARALAARGARLSLVGLEPDLLASLAAELGGDAAWFEADVTDRAALDAAVAGTVERFGGIDVVIANAGVAPVGTVTTLPPEAFAKTIDVNLMGVYHTIHAALPHVIASQGYILPIASGAAVMHLPMMAPYAASKAAVEALADCLRVELAPKGTKVGCAYFLFIDTDMVREADRHPADQAVAHHDGDGAAVGRRGRDRRRHRAPRARRLRASPTRPDAGAAGHRQPAGQPRRPTPEGDPRVDPARRGEPARPRFGRHGAAR